MSPAAAIEHSQLLIAQISLCKIRSGLTASLRLGFSILLTGGASPVERVGVEPREMEHLADGTGDAGAAFRLGR